MEMMNLTEVVIFLALTVASAKTTYGIYLLVTKKIFMHLIIGAVYLICVISSCIILHISIDQLIFTGYNLCLLLIQKIIFRFMYQMS